MTGKKGQIAHNAGERQAAKLRGDKHYFTGIPCKNGHVSLRHVCDSSCMKCKSEKSAKKAKNLTKQEIEKRNEYQKNYQLKWLKKNPEAYKKRQKYKKEWMRNNQNKVLANKAKRRSSEIKRTPVWLNAGHWFEIESVYKYCTALRSIGLDYHVDHIVPLQGKNVSGFHVPWNLQVIHATENFQKGNRHYVQ
jgi:hypothetical protein